MPRVMPYDGNLDMPRVMPFASDPPRRTTASQTRSSTVPRTNRALTITRCLVLSSILFDHHPSSPRAITAHRPHLPAFILRTRHTVTSPHLASGGVYPLRRCILSVRARRRDMLSSRTIYSRRSRTLRIDTTITSDYILSICYVTALLPSARPVVLAARLSCPDKKSRFGELSHPLTQRQDVQ